MKKYKVIWFEGYMGLEEKARHNILAEMETEAESIDKVNFIQILPESEKERFAANIRHCVRIAWPSGDLKDAKEIVSDYGSYSRFIYVEEIE